MTDLVTPSALFEYAYVEPFIIPAGEVRTGFRLSGKIREAVEVLLRELLREYQEKSDCCYLVIKANVLKLLALLARQYRRAADLPAGGLFASHRDQVAAVLEYLHQKYTEELYIRDICAVALMSKSSLSDVFRQATGKTLIAYVSYLRIKKAEELLSDPGLSTLDVCMRVGYNDSSYFSRVFRKETGVSPKMYRQMIQAGA